MNNFKPLTIREKYVKISIEIGFLEARAALGCIGDKDEDTIRSFVLKEKK